MNQYPPIQIVDENDLPVGGASLENVHREGLLHRIVMILVLNPEGKILLQKRGSKVATHPNHWDVSAAGHVDVGEDYLSAAHRELKEEIGLDGVELEELGYFRANDTFEGKILNRFKTVYRTIVPASTTFKIEPTEVSEVRWFTPVEIKHLIADEPDKIIYDFTKILEQFYL